MMRGQMTIINLIYILVLLVVLGVMMPLYYQFVNNLLNTVPDPTVRLIISLIPFAIAAGVLATIVSMGRTGGYYA